MNNKETELHKIVDIVADCCAMQIAPGQVSLTSEDVLGESRSENVVMTRCILVSMLRYAGYSTTTAALLLKRRTQTIRHLNELAKSFHETSRAYRIAEAEATLRCRDLLRI